MRWSDLSEHERLECLICLSKRRLIVEGLFVVKNIVLTVGCCLLCQNIGSNGISLLLVLEYRIESRMSDCVSKYRIESRMSACVSKHRIESRISDCVSKHWIDSRISDCVS